MKGPIGVDGIDGERYLQIFTEIDTKWREIYLSITKSDAIKHTIHLFDNKLASEGAKCLELFSDGGAELISADMVKVLNSRGCVLKYSAPYLHQQNGLAEISNKIVWEAAYSGLTDSVMPSSFWTKAVLYTKIVINMLPTNTSKGRMSPMQAKYGVVPNMSTLRRWGCLVYAHIDASQRDRTMTDKAYKGYFVGINFPMMDQYEVFVPSLNKFIWSGSVTFDEVTELKRDENNQPDFLIVDNNRKTKSDYQYLVNLLYIDPDNNISYVTTRIHIQKGYLVAFRAPYVNNKLGAEESIPIHAQDVENMTKDYMNKHEPKYLENNILKSVSVASRDEILYNSDTRARGLDHPTGTPRPATTAPTQSVGSKKVTSTQVESVSSTDCSTTSTPRQSESNNTGNSVPLSGVTTERGRIRRQREPLNVSQFGNIKDRICYLHAKEIPIEDETHKRWIPCKLEELKSCILENKIWKLERLPPGRKAISTKWVVKEKTFPSHRFKGRITPRGFSQKPGIDYKETFAPVARITTLRVFLCLVAILGLYTCQLDLKTAFLNAPLDEIIYCQPLHDQLDLTEKLLRQTKDPGSRITLIAQIKALKNGCVLRMVKACYGLKQAPRQWWKMLNQFLIDQGFKSIHSDICLYVLHLPGGAFVLLLIYVDDILIAATTPGLVSKYSSIISKKFRVSNVGPLENYLNIQLKHYREQRLLTLNMSTFCEKACSRFNIVPKPSVRTPLPENFNISLEEEIKADNEPNFNFQYREKIGVILYFMLCMAPQLAYAVQVLARHCERPNRVACAGVTRVLQYMYNIRNSVLKLGGYSAEIRAYFDADWAGDRITRRSTSGFIMFLGFGPIDWGSKLQKVVANSTAEAEIVASNAPCKAVVWLRWLLKQLEIPKITTKFSSALFGDNMACIKIAENPIHHERTKHIAIKYFYARDLQGYGVITHNYVNSKRNYSDMMTKSQGANLFGEHVPKVLGGEELEPITKRQRTMVSDEFA